LKRTPLPRGKPPRRFKRINPVSPKARARRADRAACRAVVYERDRGLCRAKIPHVCRGKGGMVHELLTRARLGSITDPANCILVCLPCSNWIHANDVEATERGLLQHSWRME
jgi:hypothetical protein